MPTATPEPHRTGTETSPLTSSGNGQRPCRVLVVDDSEDDRFIVGRAIKRNPQFTCVASLGSAQEAIAYLRRDPPFSDPAQHPAADLVLLDLKMPGMDGFAVLEYLRQFLPDRPFKVIVLTSSNVPGDMRRSLELGADGFETKPPDHFGYLQMLQKLAVADCARPQT